MKILNIKCKLQHLIPTMVICGSYVFKFNVSSDMKKWHNKGGGCREGATHLCLTLIVKELKINVEHGKVVTTLNINFV